MTTDPIAQLQARRREQVRAQRAAKRPLFEAMQAGGLEDDAKLHGKLCAALNTRADAGACGNATWNPDRLDAEDIHWTRCEL